MSARAKARKAALDLLFAADLKGREADSAELELMEREHREYTDTLVSGVHQHKDRIDLLIHTYAEGWDKDRLPAVDRNILRLGIFEVLWGDMDDSVAISEAVSLAETLSTADSARFINGMLSKISKLSETLA
ncbi:MAG: transcription antitermination factor NusB [Candidatus Nanopelagicaceae bacterium]|jgi:N utilization substance protein B